MHSELVMNMSTSRVVIIGPAAAGPSIATISGTPMKPEFGNAATSAPNAAFFRSTLGPSVTAMVKNTISSADAAYTASATGSSKVASGSPAPKRNSMHGSAKNSTYTLRPGIALSGSIWRRAAT